MAKAATNGQSHRKSITRHNAKKQRIQSNLQGNISHPQQCKSDKAAQQAIHPKRYKHSKHRQPHTIKRYLPTANLISQSNYRSRQKQEANKYYSRKQTGHSITQLKITLCFSESMVSIPCFLRGHNFTEKRGSYQ